MKPVNGHGFVNLGLFLARQSRNQKRSISRKDAKHVLSDVEGAAKGKHVVISTPSAKLRVNSGGNLSKIPRIQTRPASCQPEADPSSGGAFAIFVMRMSFAKCCILDECGSQAVMPG